MRAKSKVEKEVDEEYNVAEDRESLAREIRRIQYAYDSLSRVPPWDANDEKGDVVDTVWCPRCQRRMSAAEVQRKFRRDNTLDITTRCPDKNCKQRFQTSFLLDSHRFVWLCPDQTKDQFNLWLEECENVYKEDEYYTMLKDLKEERSEIYFNAFRYSRKYEIAVDSESEDFTLLRRMTPYRYMAEFLGFLEEQEEEEDEDEEAKEPLPKKNKKKKKFAK